MPPRAPAIASPGPLVTLAALVGVVAALVAVGPAGAQELDDRDAVATALEIDGYVVVEGSDADPNDAEDLAAEATTADPPWYFVFSGPVDESPSVVAEELRRLVGPATLVVLAEVEGPDASFDVGMASDVLDDAEIDAVLDDAAASLGGDPTATEVAAAVFTAGRDGGDGATNDDGGDGVSAVAVLVVVAVVAVVAVGGFVWLRRSVRQRDARDVENARAEIAEQLDVVANEILENADRVRLSGNEEAIESYRRASTAYADVSERIDATTDLLELRDLNDRIDEARWLIEVAEALAEGREPPPEPTDDDPAACFFDPTHRAGTERAVIDDDGTERTVRVCRDCRDRLDRGERPEPRLVTVNSRPVPAAKAPRSHGGLGLGGLDVFDVIGGIGTATRMPHRWGGPGRRAPRMPGPGTGRRRMGGAGRGRRRF